MTDHYSLINSHILEALNKKQGDEAGAKVKLDCGCILELQTHDKFAHYSEIAWDWEHCQYHKHQPDCELEALA